MLCAPWPSGTGAPPRLEGPGALLVSNHRPATFHCVGSESCPFQNTNSCSVEYSRVFWNRFWKSAWLSISTQMVRDSAEVT